MYENERERERDIKREKERRAEAREKSAVRGNYRKIENETERKRLL